MRLACSTRSFSQERLDMAVARVSWAGFPAVELYLPGADLPEEAQLRSRLREDNLELAAIHAGTFAPDRHDTGSLARVGRAAALARSLDGALVVVDAPAEGDRAAFFDALSLLSGALGDLPVDLCVANRAGTLLSEPESLRDLLSGDLPARIGLALDPAQAVLAGWNPLELSALPQTPRHVYLNDAQGGKVLPPGEGELDLGALGEALAAQGYGGAVSLVLENAEPWSVEPTARQIAAVAPNWFSGL